MRLWLDTEFNGFGGELISIALVDEVGNYFYAALECTTPTQWVAENVLPFLKIAPMGLSTLQHGLRNFLATYPAIEVIADWPEDISHFCNTLILSPGQRMNVPPLTMTLCTQQALPSPVPHNALSDALALRAAFVEAQSNE